MKRVLRLMTSESRRICVYLILKPVFCFCQMYQSVCIRGERENCPILPFHSVFACQKNYLVGNTHSWLTVVFKFTSWFSTCYVFNILDRFCLVYSPRRFIHGSERSTTLWVNSNRRCWTWFIDSRACNFTTTPIWFIAQLTIGSNLFLIVFVDSWNM